MFNSYVTNYQRVICLGFMDHPQIGWWLWIVQQDRRVIVCPLCDMAIPHTGDENVLFEAHMASGACVPKVKTETWKRWGWWGVPIKNKCDLTIESWDSSTFKGRYSIVWLTRLWGISKVLPAVSFAKISIDKPYLYVSVQGLDGWRVDHLIGWPFLYDWKIDAYLTMKAALPWPR